MTNGYFRRYDDKPLNLDSDTFEEMKSDFADVMTVTLANMIDRKCDEAAITIKLGISLKKDAAPDLEAGEPGKTRPIVRPVITHKIGTQLTMKYEQVGNMAGDYELVQLEGGEFVMRAVDDGQRTLFDRVDPDTGELVEEE